MNDEGWKVDLFCDGRTSVGGVIPQGPTKLPNDSAFKRGMPQVYQLYATINPHGLTGFAIVAICQERHAHTEQERREFLTNIAHLCDIKLGEANV